MKIKNKNFKILREEKLKDIKSTYYEFEYLPTGTKIIWIKNKDKDRAFEISFRTPPTNNKGINHILEHSVLRGSKKYPFQKEEVFAELAKKSVYTFLNAVTYPDKTVYPFSSNQKKSFYQILDIYLDAVFFPRVLEDENIFKQEGWRYDLDENGKIIFNGVVFNEMKGRYSDVNRKIWEEQTKNLFPDTVYKFESGGDPKEIIDLTYKELVDYHKKFYHPSNSVIYFYGDLKIEKIFDYLDREFLSHFKKKKINSKIKLQKKIKERIYKRVKYYSENKDNNVLSFNFVVAKANEFERKNLISFLNNLLFLNDNSILRKKLLESGLTSHIESHLENDINQVFWEINLKGVKRKNLKKLEKYFWKSLDEILKEGFSKRDIQSEFARWSRNFLFKNLKTGKGLATGDIFVKYLNYDIDDVIKIFYLKKRVELLKNKVFENGFFEKLLKNILIKNQHSLVLELIADDKIDEEKELKQKLKKINSLNENKKNKILTEIKKFKEWQKIEEPKENLNLIKPLTKKDFPQKLDKLDYKVYRKKYLHQRISEPVTSSSFVFDISHFDEREYQYLELFIQLFNAHNYHFQNLNKKETDFERNKIFEKLIFFQSFYENKKRDLERKLFLNFQILTKEKNNALNFLNLVFNELVLEKKDLENLIKKNILKFKESLAYSGVSIVIAKNSSSISRQSYLKEITEGLSFYEFLKDIDLDLAFEKIQEIYKKLFLSNKLVISEISKKDDSKIFEKLKLNNQKFNPKEISFERGREKLALVEKTLRNSFNSLTIKIEEKKISGQKLNILLSSLSYDYLWKKIREEGGAYGATAYFNEEDNTVIFASWMDSRVDGTYEDFISVIDYLDSLDLTNQEIETLIVKRMGDYWKPRTILMYPVINYLNEFSEKNKREKEYKEILSFKKSDIRKIVEELKRNKNNLSFVSLGGEDQLKKSKILKDFKEIR